MDTSDEIIPDVAIVPEPIPSAIHAVVVESLETEKNDINQQISGDHEEQLQMNEGKLKNKLTSGFKKVLSPFGKSATAVDKIIQPDGEDVIASPDDGELTGQQQLNDQQANNSKTNKFTSGIKNVFSFGNKSDPVIDDANLSNNNEPSTDPAISSSWTDGIKSFLPFSKKTPGAQDGDGIEMLTGDAEASNNPTTNSPAGAAAAAANNKMPTLNGATAPQQDADFTIISDGFNNKKTLANGLMDFAFLTANANQLHYALASRTVLGVDRVISIVLISTSIFLQIIAGIILITGSYIQAKPIPAVNRNSGPNSVNSVSAYLQWRARVMNLIDHWTIALVFMIAIINIFIAAFATGTSSIDTTPTPDQPIEPEVYSF